MARKTTLMLMVILGALYYIGCGESEKKSEQAQEQTQESSVAQLDADLQVGKENFEMTCASCHGELGAGDGAAASALNPKPRNFKAPASEWRNGPTVAGVTKTLKEGIKGTAMVSYSHLGDDIIEKLAKYVVYLHQK